MNKVRLVPGADAAQPEMIPSDFVPAHALRDGDPRETALTHLDSADGKLSVGVWSAQPYAEHVDAYEGYEYTVILQGRVTLTDADGRHRSFSAGDAFTIEPGWSGEYRVDEPLVKHFVFYETAVA
jgi:uncharacterized cupin superfamily protein